MTETYGKLPNIYNLIYELQKWLVAYGQDAVVMDLHYPFPVDKNDLIIYPEYFPYSLILNGIPITSIGSYNSKNAVCYILNKPENMNTVQTKFYHSKISFAYNKELSKHSNGNILTVPHYEPQFKDYRLENHYNCHWMGSEGQSFFTELKNGNKKVSWPNSSFHLVELLNRTKYFFAYQRDLQVATKAKYCGCMVKRIINNRVVDYEEIKIIDKQIFHVQINDFINKIHDNIELPLADYDNQIEERLYIEKKL